MSESMKAMDGSDRPAQDRLSAAELAWWDARPLARYRVMLDKHRKLWSFVRRYIAAHGIQHVLEIGCGLIPPARAWVPHYQGIDLNRVSDALHQDFVTMDVTPWSGVELVLACGVIEHTGPAYEEFLRQIQRIHPARALVSFFQPLARGHTALVKDRRGFWINRFRRQDLLECLERIGLAGRIRRLSRTDAVLIVSNVPGEICP